MNHVYTMNSQMHPAMLQREWGRGGEWKEGAGEEGREGGREGGEAEERHGLQAVLVRWVCQREELYASGRGRVARKKEKGEGEGGWRKLTITVFLQF